MSIVIASKDRPKQLAEIAEILTGSELMEAREFSNGVTVARYITASGAHACTVGRNDNLKLWMNDHYSPIADKYDFFVNANLYAE
jgi:hypothetical protein|nr:MAG TPA: hypothetical protein [Caudoviricetes sp.]